MNRRAFIAALGGAAAWPIAAGAQQPERKRRIAVLTGYTDSDPVIKARFEPFLRALLEHGWRDGDNVTIHYRHAGIAPGSLQQAARDLAAAAPDLIVVQGNPALAALREVDRKIPTVFVQVGDPVGSRFVDSLSRPGGNLTGFSTMEPEMGGKWLELLKEAAPSVTRVLALLQPDIAANHRYLAAIEGAGPTQMIEISKVAVRNLRDITHAFLDLSPGHGLVVLPNPLTGAHNQAIADLTIRHRVPAISPFRYFVESGGLLAYGPDVSDLFRRAASYADRMLRGDKPSDLPVQVPTKYEFVMNLKSARSLGLEIPPTLLARADEVIE
jgi:putative ABC transport system substrate-binding protein